MKHLLPVLSLVVLAACSSSTHKKKPQHAIVDKKTVGLLPTEKEPDLIEVAEFKGAQVTGVTVAKDGRMFANFPRWRENVPFSVVEIKPDGSYTPYPNVEWNTWTGKPQKNHFTSVQSVLAQGNYLYVLDPSSPEMKGVIDKAKLYRFNLLTNKLDKTWEFGSDIAPEKSYLNDFRIDENQKKIFITDSGLGGIVVLDMKNGEARRLLDKHPSTKSEGVTLTVDKTEFPRQIHSDGIAINPKDDKIYYHALSGYTLYRVPAEALKPEMKDETALVKQVEKLGVTPAPDGMVFDKQGNLYMGDLERNAVSYRTRDGDMKILIEDERIKWPDTLTLDHQNNLIFTDSMLQAALPGTPVDNMTFKIYKVKLPPVERESQEY